MSTRLIDLCEPLFQAVCRLNRMGRKGSSTDYPTARSEVLTLFEQMQQKSKGDLALSEQYRRVEMPLIFFVDSMIAESTLRFAAEWNRNRLAYERNELAGDEKFFDLLDETLKETRDGADERLAVFYTCMGLGFSGWYSGQPEYLRKKMMEIAPRVRTYVDADETGLITPDSYQHTNTMNLPMPMAASLVPLLIILGGLFLVVGGVNIYSFRSASKELNAALDAIAERGPERAVANPSP
jgi:type IV/VI secretion system ImpK/VasF family protein